MINMNRIGKYIKEERKKAGLTQEEFAMRSGGTQICERTGAGKRDCASGQSKPGTGNVRKRSCTGREGGVKEWVVI